MTISLTSTVTTASLKYEGATAFKFNAGGIVGGLTNSAVQNSFTVPAGSNSMIVGPITLPAGQIMTIAPDSRLVIL